MGAYSPVPIADDLLIETAQKFVLEPAIHGLMKYGAPYCGVLYAGLMICDGKPYVIEFNCRFGDPETQVVLPLHERRLAAVACCGGAGRSRSQPSHYRVAERSLRCYGFCRLSGRVRKGKPINGLDSISSAMDDRAIVFHAGVKKDGDRILTDGGRVLGVTGLGEDFDEAYENAYEAVNRIQFDNAYYRKDIGYRVRNK